MPIDRTTVTHWVRSGVPPNSLNTATLWFIQKKVYSKSPSKVFRPRKTESREPLSRLR
jgi:hypothetical protein